MAVNYRTAQYNPVPYGKKGTYSERKKTEMCFHIQRGKTEEKTTTNKTKLYEEYNVEWLE